MKLLPFLLIPYYFQLKELKNPEVFEHIVKFNFIMDKKLFGYFFISLYEIDNKLIENITNTEFLRVIFGKKIHIQYKGKTDIAETTSSQFFVASKGNFEFILIIKNEIIKNFLDYYNVVSISELEKKLYAILTNPVSDIDKYILALPDNKLQLLLNHILAKKIASIDMLAAYIRNLGERGERILKNFSTRVKTELTEKIRAIGIYSTYRWAKEVNYIINRNILVSANELKINLPFFSRFDHIKKAYHIAVLKKEFENRNLFEWLNLLSSEEIKKLILETNRKMLANSLTFLKENEIIKIFSTHFSANGFKILLEDINYAHKHSEDEKYFEAYLFLKKVKEIYYEKFIKDLDFREHIEKYITTQEDVDLLIDEVGFAKVLYAFKNTDEKFQNKVLTGIIKNIFEDITKGKIRIKDYYDSRIQNYEKEVLKVAIILNYEKFNL
ncbi:MAG: hypothetical protein N2258_01270 [Brevinematales bacterium]|nr:hypothetical protein [Brevinematales bacterium]